MHQHKHMSVSIWFFIGSLLTVYGVLITAADIWYHNHPAVQPVVLSEYRAGFWWGLLLLALGLFYCIRFRPGKSD